MIAGGVVTWYGETGAVRGHVCHHRPDGSALYGSMSRAEMWQWYAQVPVVDISGLSFAVIAERPDGAGLDWWLSVGAVRIAP
jgi:hypothetical protein